MSITKSSQNKNELLLKFVAVLLFSWGVFINLAKFPRLDVDLYHDGFIYPMALLVSQGGIPNIDTFSSYGPLVPLIQGAWLEVFGLSVFQLRLHGALLIVTISLLLLLLTRNHFGNAGACLISAMWLVGNPIILQPSLPWVDLYTTLIQLLGIAYIKKLSTVRFLKSVDFFRLGLFLSTGVLVKINFGLPLIFMFILLVFYFGFRNALFFAQGVLVTFGFAVAVMYFIGSLMGYIEQGVIFHFSRGYTDGKSVRGLFSVRILLFGLLIMFFLALLNKINCTIKIKNTHLTVISVAVSMIAGLTSYHFRKLEVPFTSFTGDIQKNLSILLKNSPYALLYGSVLVVIFSIILLFLRRKKTELDEKSAVMCIIGASSLLQLYPNPEPGHIWFIFPILVAGLAPWFRVLLQENTQRIFYKLILIPICASLVTINVEYMAIQREPHRFEPLVGMYSRVEWASRVDYNLSKLDEAITNKTVQYDCLLGIYSVANNKYRGSDYQFVETVPKFSRPKASSDLIFACDLNLDEVNALIKQEKILLVTNGPWPYGVNALYENSLSSQAGS